MTEYLFGYGRTKHIPEPGQDDRRGRRRALCGNWGSPWSWFAQFRGDAEPERPVCKSCERADAARAALRTETSR